MSVLGLLFSAFVAFAAVTSWKTHHDVKAKFKIDYPAQWKVQSPTQKDSPQLAGFANKDDSILVSLLFSKNEKKLSAVDFLNQMDQSRKSVNQIPEAQRKLSEEVLKKVGAEDGAVGYYEIPSKKPVLQRTMVFVRKKEVFVITGTFQKAREAEEDPLVESLLASFQFTP